MKKFTPLSQLPREAASVNRTYLRTWADELIGKKEHGDDVDPYHLSLAESFVQLDDHMKSGGELPIGWSFFSEYGRDNK